METIFITEERARLLENNLYARIRDMESITRRRGREIASVLMEVVLEDLNIEVENAP